MNDIYDESGTVVATHPIQEAQHDGVTVIGLSAQPQVSDSDWDDAYKQGFNDGFGEAKHRQTAAMSADAAEYYKHHADNFAAILQKLGSYASGWNKPYLVSEIERFKQDVAMPYLHEEERKRALSPETVCGGE